VSERPPLLDLPATARRLRRVLVTIAVLVLVAWAVRSVMGGAARLEELAALAGLGLLAAFLVEVVVVGGAALAGMLEAGARGERLSGPDVALLPPQWRRRLARRALRSRDDAC
jgi:hypothetical protein